MGRIEASAAGSVTFASNEAVQLRVGSSSILIEPDRIVIEAEELLLQAKRKISAAQGEDQVSASLVLQGGVSLAGGGISPASGAEPSSRWTPTHISTER